MLILILKRWLWERTGFSRQSNRRRTALSDKLWRCEDLETRQLLSTFNGADCRGEATEVATPIAGDKSGHSGRTDKSHVVRSKISPIYPDVTGTWSLEAAAHIDDDPTLNFSGTAVLTQKHGRRVGGKVDLEGLPAFRIRGTLGKTNTFELNGSTRFPVETSNDRFFFLRGHLTVTFNQDLTAFTGRVHRVIFGYHIDVDLDATNE